MPIIELSGITKRYGDNVVLDAFDLSVEKGEFLAITGKSGAGKSTLLNIIGLLEPQDSGTLCICNQVNPRLNKKDGRQLLRYKISYLFQNYGLVEEITVEKNLMIAAKYAEFKDKKDSIRSALESVGLQGYEKKKVYQLSGGEQQRIALAKIMVRPCEIILADEPTGSLDADNRNRVLELLQELHKNGKTVIMVTHDEVACNYAQRMERL